MIVSLPLPSFLPPSSSPPSSSLFPSSSFFPSSSLFPSSLFLPSAEDSFHKQVEWLQTKLVEMDQYDSDLVQHSRVKAQVHIQPFRVTFLLILMSFTLFSSTPFLTLSPPPPFPFSSQVNLLYGLSVSCPILNNDSESGTHMA